MPAYNLIEYSLNYSETKGSVCFYSRDEATDLNNNIASTDDFKSFKYKAKLLGNTDAQPNSNNTNEILKNAAITVSLKYLSNFEISLEMPLPNCKVELKLKWTKYCVLITAGNDDDNDNGNNIIFTISDTKLHVLVLVLSERDNQQLSELLSKGFETSVYWNECKTKCENKNTTNEYRYFFESNFVGVNRLFGLVYSNQDAYSKRFKT